MSIQIGPRVAAALSVVFTLFLFLAVASLEVPRSASDQELTDWWSKTSNQDSAIASMYFMAFAAIALVPFLAYLRARLAAADDTAGTAVFALGFAFALLLLASAAARGVVASAVRLNDEPLPGVDTLRYTPQLAYAFLNIGLVTMGACLLLFALGVVRSKALPGWFGWASAAAGALLIVGTPVIGPLTLPVLWMWALAGAAAVWNPAMSPALRAAGAVSALAIAAPAFLGGASPVQASTDEDAGSRTWMSRAQFVAFDLARDNALVGAGARQFAGNQVSRPEFLDFDLEPIAVVHR